MALIVEDRVMEASTSTGTGDITLSGAYTGFRAFSAVCATSDTLYYLIEAIDGDGVPTGDWETGFGTYSAANTLTRTTVSRSSNGDAAVNFGAGTKRVSISLIATQLAGARWTELDNYDFASGAASTREVDVTGYKEIHVLGDQLVHAASVQRAIQFSVDGGSTWFTTSGDYQDIAAAGSGANNACIFSHSTATTAARNFAIHILDNDGRNPVNIDVITRGVHQVFRGSATAVNRIRLMGSAAGSGTPSVSDFTAGTLRVRGRG